VLLIDDPKLPCVSHKNLFTLVVKVGTFVDMSKILEAYSFGPNNCQRGRSGSSHLCAWSWEESAELQEKQHPDKSIS